MIETLKFVRGAVATKDLVPVLTHFHIYDGRIQGGNGQITIDAACPRIDGLRVTVPAERFLKAVDACGGQPKIKITDGGKMSLSHGKFRALLPLGNPHDFPQAEADTDIALKGSGDLLAVFRRLREFIGDDASRPWACGVLLKKGYAYATNNVILCRIPCEWNGDPITIPAFALNELIRINAQPTSITGSDRSLTFHYSNGWLKTQLFDTPWPDVDKFFEEIEDVETTVDVPKLIDAIQKVLPFCPDPKFPVIHLSEKGVSTADGEMMAEMQGLKLDDAVFRAEPLLAVLGVIDKVDFSHYPKPCPFSGNGIVGVLIGVRT